MFLSSKTIKLSFFAAILFIAGFYIYQSFAAQKINASKVNNLTSGLVGYWTFDGADMNATTATDMSANDNTATINGTVTKVPGKVGQALNFDGSTGYLSVAGTPNLGITTGITECAWVYQKSNSDNQYVLHYASSADGDGFGIKIDAGGVLIATDVSSNNIYSNTAISLNKWYHICATISIVAGESNDDFKVYVNGAMDGDSESNNNYNPNLESGGLKIGDKNTNDKKFNGLIDEVRIYSRALSQSEITELYQQGQTKINASQVGKLTNGLTGYWSFDGNNVDWSQANEIRDASGNGNHANAINMTTANAAIGKIGQALNFNGSSGYVDPNISISGLFGSSGKTISVWLKPMGPSSSSSDFQYLPNIFGDANNGAFGMARGNYNGNGDKIWAYATYVIISPFSLTKCIAGFNYSQSEWVYAVMVFNNNIIDIYKNGSLIQSSACSGGWALGAGQAFQIGRMDTTVASYFNGLIDEMRTYNRVLSQSEITELYQQGQTKINASQAGKLTNGLVGYWPMDGNYVDWSAGDGKEIRDASGYGNHGDVVAITQSDAMPGRIGQAFLFNSSTDQITITDSGATLDPTSGITISAWVDWDGGGNNISTILNKCTGGACANGYRLTLDNNSNCDIVIDGIADIFFSYGNKAYCAPNAFSSNTGWHNVAVTASVSGGSVTLSSYLDGQLFGTPTTSTDFSTDDNIISIIIGNRSPSYFSGSLDEVRIYNRALSASEVAELYDQGR